jgi:hypothetical protein
LLDINAILFVNSTPVNAAYKVHEDIADHLHAQRMVLPRIPHDLQKPHARILLLVVPCPRSVDEVLVC